MSEKKKKKKFTNRQINGDPNITPPSCDGAAIM